MRTSKKQIHELERYAREQLDPSALLYAVGERDATRKAYAVICGNLTAYKSNNALFSDVMDQIAAYELEEPYYTAEDAAVALIDAYAEAIGEQPANDEPEAIAARAVARREIVHHGERRGSREWEGYINEQYATIASMVEAIASKAREAAERAAVEAAATPEAYAEAMGSCEDATNLIAYGAYEAMHAGTNPETADEVRELDRLMGYAAEIVQRDGAAHSIEWEEYRVCAEDAREAWEGAGWYRIAWSDGPAYGDVRYYEDVADLAQDLASAYQSATDTHLPYAERYERPTYQRHELEAYLGEYVDDYDVDAIEAEATEYDPKTGARVWTAFGDDLAAIADRHAL